jgi:hypothetical protein
MKIPPYIKKEDIEATAKLGRDIREEQGISAYLFFKRLATVAMYGEIERGKITYTDFLKDAIYCNRLNHNIFYIWNYNVIKKGTSETTYFINRGIIKFGTQAEVEREIVRKILYAETNLLRMEKRNMIEL